jgi:hypothetical protein
MPPVLTSAYAMKYSPFNPLRSVFERVFRIGDYRPKADTGMSTSWKLLLGSPGAHISVACRPASGRRERILFRHSFSGYTRIELRVRQNFADGRSVLHQFRGRGHAFATLSSGRNVIPNDINSQLLIESIRVQFIAHGLSYDLNIDEKNKHYQLLREGKPFPHGPQYLLALDELPPCRDRPLSTRPAGFMSIAATL